jgi:hypothetical protein
MSTLKVIQIQHPSAASAALTLDASGNLSTSGTLTFPAGSASSPSIQATGDPNTGLFFPAADTIAFAEGGTEVLRIDSSGRVGIGTSAPGALLDVAGTNGRLYLRDGSANTAKIVALNAAGTGAAALIFETYNLETARIDSSGRLGIGTASPTKTLEVIKSSAGGTTIQFSDATNATGRLGTPSIGVVAFGGNTDHNIVFGAWASDGNSFTSERVRIDTAGRLLVGTSTPASNINDLKTELYGNVKLGANLTAGRTGGDYDGIGYNVGWQASVGYKYVVSDTAAYIRFGSSSRIETFTAAGSTAGSGITFTAGPYVALGGTSWTSSSDERLKEDLLPIENALDKTTALRTVTGRFKTDPKDKRRLFLIAQDVKTVFPEAVDETDPESLGLDYPALIPFLVAALKESKERIENLEAEMLAMRNV